MFVAVTELVGVAIIVRLLNVGVGVCAGSCDGELLLDICVIINGNTTNTVPTKMGATILSSIHFLSFHHGSSCFPFCTIRVEAS